MPSTLSKLVKFQPSLRDTAPAIIGTSAVFLVVHLYKKHYNLGYINLFNFELFEIFSKTENEKSLVIKSNSTSNNQPKKDKAHVDWNFVKKIYRICKILIPSLFSAEIFYMLLIAFTLLLRTYADVWMITTSTQIEA